MARYDKGHRDTTRRHILDVASAQFRESGIAAVGLAGIMSEAGLTNGAFYTHFESKEDLVRAVLLRCAGAARAAAQGQSRERRRARDHDPRLPLPAPSRPRRRPAARLLRWLPKSRGIRRRRAMRSPERCPTSSR